MSDKESGRAADSGYSIASYSSVHACDSSVSAADGAADGAADSGVDSGADGGADRNSKAAQCSL